MQMTQFNTRIPVALKRSGDEVLARFGKSASEAVRDLWSYMDRFQSLPECMMENQATSESIAKRLASVESAQNLLQDFYCQQKIEKRNSKIDYDSLQSEAYDAMLSEYRSLDD